MKFVIGALLLLPAGTSFAQKVDREDLSEPTPGEIAMAAECRNTHRRMRQLDKLLNESRDELNALGVTISKSEKDLDNLKAAFEQRAAKSQESDEAYQAAVKAKKEYEDAAGEHNKLIDQQDALLLKRTTLTDEFYVVNPNYVAKCSGTVFKAKSIILTCKDERSEWCDLLK
jgi:septal ring factor EnvC (AmiA/AmiB activator)